MANGSPFSSGFDAGVLSGRVVMPCQTVCVRCIETVVTHQVVTAAGNGVANVGQHKVSAKRKNIDKFSFSLPEEFA